MYFDLYLFHVCFSVIIPWSSYMFSIIFCRTSYQRKRKSGEYHPVFGLLDARWSLQFFVNHQYWISNKYLSIRKIHKKKELCSTKELYREGNEINMYMKFYFQSLIIFSFSKSLSGRTQFFIVIVTNIATFNHFTKTFNPL